MKNKLALAGVCAIMLSAAPVAAFAGPCSDDIAAIGKQLSQSAALGPVSSGTVSGSNPGAATAGNSASAPDKAGTSASSRLGGTAGTKEMGAAAGNVATSDADVRRQQAGHPTAEAQSQTGKGTETAGAVQGAGSGNSSDRMSRAKVDWQKAVDLNAQNDGSCKNAVAQARSDLQGS